MIAIGAVGSLPTSGTQAAGGPAPIKPDAPDPSLLKAAKEFESIFVRQMLKSLEKTTAAGGNTKPTAGQSTYGSMIVDSLSDSISKGGGLGLADVVARSMMATHAMSKPAAATPGAAGAAVPGLIPVLNPLK
ncbi:MAG TPA: rod-binding protein [Polyangiaceae bacterium]